ncbi:MAG: hypothetical protein M3362_22980, partial [Acidobacteriota bacterium]|nr:hypothetical protein [Acidobacteriota bacterium]
NLSSHIVGLFLIALFTTSATSAVQTNSPLQEKVVDLSPRKVDDFEYLDTDSEGARLDAFAIELGKEPQSRGYIISYNQRDIPPGRFLRRIYGDKHYLVNYRGIEPNRLVVVNGGYREKFRTELWLVPNGASPPKPTPTIFDVPDKIPLKFDGDCLLCAPAVDIDVGIFSEGLEYYGEALQAKPSSRARIIIFANRRREGTKLLALARNTLIRKFQVEPSRITIVRSRRFDPDGIVEFWIVP